MKKYFLSFATNFKDENPYLKEWIDFHLSVGVDHFYLFDQCGSQKSKEILEPYKRKNIVTVHDWTNISSKYEGATCFFQKNKNHMGYMYAARHYRNKTEWLLKIDMDEFLLMANGDKTVKSWLNQLDSDKIRAVRIPRVDFGSNGHISKPSGDVVENYLRREKEASNYKDMANAAFLNNNNFCFSSHRWSYRFFPRGKLLKLTGLDQLRINHYYTKSKEEYFERQNISRGRNVSEEDFQIIEERTNQVYDDTALRYLSAETE